ncbi:MAG: aminotransferase class I/II-fold pyridoxal phosphate-dependent enzyme [Saprospirales bacterium]|nr:MAG: aminotransferase class I/II-fold pyridoxal phosphate-dependent enzyme [Saprospirales bacterium]
MKSSKERSYETICAREWKSPDQFGSHILPLYQSNSFEAKTMEDAIEVFSGRAEGYIYSRYANPTIRALEEKLAVLEGLESGKKCYSLLTSSGMSAISTVCNSILKPGGAILIHPSLYGGTLEYFKTELSRPGHQILQIDLTDARNLKNYLKDGGVKPDLIFIETPTNPGLEILDISALSKCASSHNIPLVVDNTFCTSYLQRPLELGADIVVYSTTKFINGHGNSMGGLIVSTNEELIKKQLWKTMKLTGTNPSPFEAWVIYQGLKTLPLRMNKQCSNAREIAAYLQDKKSKVLKVNYPGLSTHKAYHLAGAQMKQPGSMLSFELDANLEQTIEFCNSLDFSKAPTLGDLDTLVLHPATSSHINITKELRLKTGVSDSLIRLSVGIEDHEDLIYSLEKAFSRAFG